MNVRVFIVALAVILLFKNGLGGRLAGHHVEFMVWASPVCTEHRRALTAACGGRRAGAQRRTGSRRGCAGGRGEVCAGPAAAAAPPGCAAGASADGGAVREGQPVTRAALQRSCCAVRRDCARGHGRACRAAEHSGLGRSGFPATRGPGTSPFFMFLHVFWRCRSTSKTKLKGSGPFFVIFCGTVTCSQKTALKDSGLFLDAVPEPAGRPPGG